MRIVSLIALSALLLIGVWPGFSSVRRHGGPGNTPARAAVSVQTRPPPATLPAEPPQGIPLADSYRPLAVRARAGDAEAAKRLFTETSTCLRVARLDAAFQADLKDKNSFLNNPDGFHEDAKQKAADIDVIEKEMDEIRQVDPLCANMPADFNDGRIYQVALEAARAGDSKATACLLLAQHDSPRVTPQQGRAYAAEVMQLADDGLRRGDWNVALAMPFVYSSRTVDNFSSHLGYAGFLMRPDPVKQLEYSELIRLGTLNGSPVAARLDRRLSLLREMLSPAQRAEADRWAQETYATYYSHSGPVDPETMPCDI